MPSTAAPASPAPAAQPADAGPQRLLAGLDDEQLQAVLAPAGPVCILAGAGTGKTRAITHRIAYHGATGGMPAGQVLAVTFTARAAGELRARLRSLGAAEVQARTFHAAALRQLSYFWPRALGGAMPTVTARKIGLVAEAAGRLRLQAAGTELRDLTAELEWAKATLTTPERYPAAAAAAGRQPPRPADQVAALAVAYEEVKTRAGALDFDDLLLLCAAILEEHEDIAEEIRARYRHVVVDEYQDVTPAQQRLLDAWLGGRSSVTVVGDAAQTIYTFTGASARPLLDFPRRYPDATVVRLVRDYRSTPQVVGLANAVLSRATDRVAGAGVTLVAQRPDGPAPRVLACASEVEEAAGVAAAAAALIAAGTPAAEIAVLFRINAQSEAFESAFADAGIPVVLRGGERFFDRPEVKEAVQLLRAAARSADADPDGSGSARAAATAVLSATGWSPTPPSAGSRRERWENLAALLALAEDAADLPALVAELEARSAAQHAPVVQGVTLASLHAAKGLEWDAVFLAGCTEGTLPLIHASTPAQVEEERRLLYVGVTRARVHLTVSWAAARADGGRRTRRPSRFLDGLLPGLGGATGAGPAAAGGRAKGKSAARCRVCGAVLGSAPERTLGHCTDCPADRDEALYARLREWRADRARGLGQPAYCVFTDATLAAIAERRPAAANQLVTIPGVGSGKLTKFGDEVLALCSGQPLPPTEGHSA